MLHPALVTLLRLRLRGFVRRMFRGVKTVRGAIMFGCGAFMFVMWLAPSLFSAAVHAGTDPLYARNLVPVGMLVMCVINVFLSDQDRGIRFLPAEVDFLFSGPFTRRQLLVYKFAGTFAGALFAAAIFSMAFLRYLPNWPAAFVGNLLTLLFIQLFSTAIVVAGQTIATHAYSLVRRIVLALVILVAAIAAWQLIRSSPKGMLDGLQTLRDSTVAAFLLWPFEVFGHALTAEHIFPDLILWSAVGLLINTGMFVVVLWLDANFLEASVTTSQRIYQRLQQVRGSGVAWTSSKRVRRTIPRLPFCFGAGPIAWKQLNAVVRRAHSLPLMLIVAGGIGMPIVFAAQRDTQGHMAMLIPAMLLMMTVMLTQMLPFDFRGDAERLDFLKSLPISSGAIAAGQLAAPVVVMTMMHAILMAGCAALLPQSQSSMLAALPFCLPFNLLLFGLENTLFLFFPARTTPSMPGDMQFLGRAMITMLGKMLVLAVSLAFAAAVGGIVYLAFGAVVPAFVASWLVLMSFAVGTVPLVAFAFRQFDVSQALN